MQLCECSYKVCDVVSPHPSSHILLYFSPPILPDGDGVRVCVFTIAYDTHGDGVCMYVCDHDPLWCVLPRTGGGDVDKAYFTEAAE